MSNTRKSNGVVATTDQMWEALKVACCKNPAEAKLAVFVSEKKFREALAPFAASVPIAAPTDHDSCSHWREGDGDHCVWCGDDLGPTTEADVAAPQDEQKPTLKDHALRLINEIRECPNGMCEHCLLILVDELEPLLKVAKVELPAKDQKSTPTGL